MKDVPCVSGYGHQISYSVGLHAGVLPSIVGGHVPILLIEGVSVGRKAGSADIYS